MRFAKGCALFVYPLFLLVVGFILLLELSRYAFRRKSSIAVAKAVVSLHHSRRRDELVARLWRDQRALASRANDTRGTVPIDRPIATTNTQGGTLGRGDGLLASNSPNRIMVFKPADTRIRIRIAVARL